VSPGECTLRRKRQQLTPKTTVASSRLNPEQEIRLSQMACHLGRMPSDAARSSLRKGLR